MLVVLVSLLQMCIKMVVPYNVLAFTLQFYHQETSSSI